PGDEAAGARTGGADGRLAHPGGGDRRRSRGGPRSRGCDSREVRRRLDGGAPEKLQVLPRRPATVLKPGPSANRDRTAPRRSDRRQPFGDAVLPEWRSEKKSGGESPHHRSGRPDSSSHPPRTRLPALPPRPTASPTLSMSCRNLRAVSRMLKDEGRTDFQ